MGECKFGAESNCFELEQVWRNKNRVQIEMNSAINTAQANCGRSFDTKFDRQMPGYHDWLNGAVDKSSPPGVASAGNKNIISTSLLGLVFKITGFMALVVVALYFSSNWYGELISRGGQTSDLSLRKIVIANDVVNVPANMIRFANQRNATSLPRLDLYAQWPSLSGYSDALANDFDSLADDAPLLFVSLEPRSMSKDMTGRIEAIYGHFFGGPPVDAGNGLVRRAFSSRTAFFSEDLYYEADSPYPFAARCIRESDKIAAPFCIRDIHIGHDLMLTYRFHANLLPQWMTLDRAVRQKFGAMVQRPG